MVVPSPFLFVNWMAHKLTSPFVLQRLNAEVDTLRLGLFILLGMTGAVGYRHLEDLLHLLKAAKLILVHHPPPASWPTSCGRTKEWKGAQEDFQHARGGLTQLALYADLDVVSLRAALEVLEHWQYATRDHWAETLSASACTFKDVPAARGRQHELKPSPTWTRATLSVTSECHARGPKKNISV